MPRQLCRSLPAAVSGVLRRDPPCGLAV